MLTDKEIEEITKVSFKKTVDDFIFWLSILYFAGVMFYISVALFFFLLGGALVGYIFYLIFRMLYEQKKYDLKMKSLYSTKDK